MAACCPFLPRATVVTLGAARPKLGQIGGKKYKNVNGNFMNKDMKIKFGACFKAGDKAPIPKI